MRSGAPSSNEAIASPTSAVVTCTKSPARDMLRQALRGRAVFIEVGACQDLPQCILANQATRIAVIPARDEQGLPAVSLVRQVRGSYPDVAVIAATRADAAHAQDLAVLGAAGVHGFRFTDVDATASIIRSALESATRGCAAEVIMHAIQDLLPPGLTGFVSCCLSHPARSKTVLQVADQLGVHRKTLFNRCRALADDFGAEELVSWCRVLLSAYLLRAQERTVESIALELDVSSVTGLRNLLKKYTGRSATELRAAGAFEPAVAAFRARLSSAGRGGADATQRVSRE